MVVVAAFDIGVKNLSLAVVEFDASGDIVAIHRWANMSLVAGGADSQAQTRCPCGGPASWVWGDHRLYCKRCAKKQTEHPCLPSEIGLKSSVAAWREWSGDTKATRAVLVARAAETHLMPYTPPKSADKSLQTILAGMDTCLTAELPFIARSRRVLLENQPCTLAPTMKSVQIMLFTLLSSRLAREHAWTGRVEFVHAKRKTAGDGIAAGTEHKRERKAAGIARVEGLLATEAEWLTWFRGQAKRDDAADALLMCVDAAA